MEPTDTVASTARSRSATYFLALFGLLAVYWVLRDSTWQGTVTLHTIMEVVATVLALLVGTLALVTYHTTRNRTILLIGAGFIGTGALDGYHAVVTSAIVAPHLPMALPALIPWSWVASRFFLSLLLCLSWLEWKLERKTGHRRVFGDRYVYGLVGCLTLLSFVFFALAPLPRAYYPEYFFGRPEEFVPAALFLVALVGYLKKGVWKTDPFEHWLVLALIVSLCSQLVFMPLSFTLFDFSFDMAHILKKVTYILVLTGLLFSVSAAFRQAENSSENMARSLVRLEEVNTNLEMVSTQHRKAEAQARQNEKSMRTIFNTVPDGIITTDELGRIIEFNPGAEKMFGYTPSEVLERNVSMLMPSSFSKHHDTYMRQHRGGGGAEAIGERRNLFGLHKNGTPFAMDLTISESSGNGGEKIILGVLRDISDKKDAEDNLARFVADLEKSNKELEQFAYVASHDLKAPLRGIDNLAGFIREDISDALDEDTQRNFDLMQNRIRRMERLLEDLLAYSRAGRKSVSVETVDLNELFEDVLELAARLMTSRFGLWASLLKYNQRAHR